MSNKKGAIVAIEPGTGELLALVSAPSYNPNLLVGRHRSKNYFKLYNDSIYKPLVDKGLLSTFPAGSPFKIVVGLIALKENIINIWLGEIFHKVRKRLLNSDRNDSPCDKCDVDGLLNGGSFANKWSSYYKSK